MFGRVAEDSKESMAGMGAYLDSAVKGLKPNTIKPNITDQLKTLEGTAQQLSSAINELEIRLVRLRDGTNKTQPVRGEKVIPEAFMTIDQINFIGNLLYSEVERVNTILNTLHI